jgi:hypothetical protein
MRHYGAGRGHRARFPARGRALAAMVGLTPPPPMIGSAMTSKPIYFDSIDSCAYILAKAEHSARTSMTPGCPLWVISRHNGTFARHVRLVQQGWQWKEQLIIRFPEPSGHFPAHVHLDQRELLEIVFVDLMEVGC